MRLDPDLRQPLRLQLSCVGWKDVTLEPRYGYVGWRCGMVVRVRPPRKGKLCTALDGGVVRQVEYNGTVFVEPDYPDVDDNLEFDMWKTHMSQLLVDRR